MISPSQRPLHTLHPANTGDEHLLPSAEFKPSIPSIKRLRTYDLGRAATGIDTIIIIIIIIIIKIIMWNVKTKIIPVIIGANGTI